MPIEDSRPESHRLNSQSIQRAAPGEILATTTEVKHTAAKVILRTSAPSGPSLVLVNLAAVVAGTLKFFAWVAVISLAILGGLLAGMLRASAFHRRRHW